MRFRISRSATERVERSKVPLEFMSARTCRVRSDGSFVDLRPMLLCVRRRVCRAGCCVSTSAVRAACWLIDVVAQRRARERAPAVVAGQRLDVAAQPVEPQPVAQDEVDRRCRVQRLSR